MGTPAAEVHITANLIERLIAEQYPLLSDQPIELVASGWDNVTARVGKSHAVRLPRRELAVTLLLNEQRWLGAIAGRLDVAVPVPVFHGRPGSEYHWPWSVVPWMRGATAEVTPLDGSAAVPFGRFLAALGIEAPDDAPANRFRGTPLADHDEGVQRRWTELRDQDEQLASMSGQALSIWDSGMAADQPSDIRWLHGDLHPRNVLSSSGSLAGVIDWGDLTSGDVATDLASVWMQFAPEQHDAVWSAYGSVDAATRRRSRAWAIKFAAMLIATGLDDDPGFLTMGLTIAERAIEAD